MKTTCVILIQVNSLKVKEVLKCDVRAFGVRSKFGHWSEFICPICMIKLLVMKLPWPTLFNLKKTYLSFLKGQPPLKADLNII